MINLDMDSRAAVVSSRHFKNRGKGDTLLFRGVSRAAARARGGFKAESLGQSLLPSRGAKGSLAVDASSRSKK